MQKKDIKVGEVYAYSSHKWSNRAPVKVVSLEGIVRQGYSYSRRIVNGVTVEYTTGPSKGAQFATTGRNLVHTWAQEEKIRKADRERADAAKRDREETAARRASKARRIEDILAAHGEPEGSRSVYGDEARAALKAIGFREVESMYGGRENIVSRFDIDDWMRNGRLPEKAVTVLLADSKVEG